MPILLTGSAGFIGWKTASLLLSQGHEVVGLDNLNRYYDPALKLWRLRDLARLTGAGELPDPPPPAWSAGRFHFRRLDLEDPAALERLFSEFSFSAVINLAARAGVRYSLINPQVYFTTNALGTIHLLEAIRRHGVPKLVLASTSSLYAGLPLPFLETLPVNQPISPYAASKKAAEVSAWTWHRLYGLDVTVLRYFTVFGPAGRPDMSPLRFLQSIDTGRSFPLYGDGSQSRDFTYVDDIAAGTVAALRPLGYEIINLGGGNRPVTILDMIRQLETLTGRAARIDPRPPNPADMDRTWADIAKARALLDWEPRIPFPEGLRRLHAWYESAKPASALLDLREGDDCFP